jgi:N-acetylglucosaminyldiphosphoundecaprenol N-acetyl-beta-D-mannosaminyltransferase
MIPRTYFASTHRRIIGMRVDASTYADATARVIASAQKPEPFWLCPAGVHTVVEAHRNRLMGRAMDTASLVTTDGMPLVWSLKWLGVKGAERVYGPTLTERILDAAAARGIPVGFYGASPDTLRQLLENCRRRWPGLNIAYSFSPPFRPPSPQEDDEIIQRVRASGARILFVGLGCPKQELWAHDHYGKLGIPILAVGAAFDFIAGTKAQAPAWMQRHGLEWFFRLLAEPRRLWRRYLFGNSSFVLLLAAQLTGLRRFDHSEN